MLEQENAFYDAHQAEFREKYLDKWLVITGESLWGVYDRFAEAAKAAMKRFGQGGFMIHKPADDGKVIHFGPGNRVYAEYPDSAKRPKREAVMTYNTSGSGLEQVTFAY